MKIAAFFKWIASYLWGVELERVQSNLNGQLYVLYIKGRKILNARHGNYSFGVLHDAFRKAFRQAGITGIQPQKCLLLGLGGGSVVTILRDELKLSCFIRAIDFDPEVVSIAENHFNIKRFDNLEIIIRDAFDFVREDTDTYDLIVFDIYIDHEIPEKFESIEFLSLLKSRLDKKAILVFNKDISSKNMKLKKELFAKVFNGGRWIKVFKDSYFFIFNNG
ncbi:MAG TPA: hypothetical protein P5050_10490 [Bacteroidia bacterium]|nr:hypothetical protein [Bacteroidia bacterium]HRS59633.1 hypothetical protein [Bacteroidia bacterium]HRU68988.1 hypothetical protein [Bacteroidia bacterium]